MYMLALVISLLDYVAEHIFASSPIERESFSCGIFIFEPPRGKTSNVVSEQVRHKPTCTVTEKS